MVFIYGNYVILTVLQLLKHNQMRKNLMNQKNVLFVMLLQKFQSILDCKRKKKKKKKKKKRMKLAVTLLTKQIKPIQLTNQVANHPNFLLIHSNRMYFPLELHYQKCSVCSLPQKKMILYCLNSKSMHKLKIKGQF